MTIAVDIRTGAVVGQVCAETWRRDTSALDEYQPNRIHLLQLLTRDGYITVPATSVWVEEVR